jgi:hypothetical protein
MFDTEAEARKAFANAEGRGWNCWLFGPTLRAAAPQPSQPVEAGDPVLPVWFDTFLTNVCEIPDRNSPEGEPEAMIATAEELRNCALNAIENTAANARDRDERPISPADISAAADAVQRTYGVSGDIAEQIAVAVIDTLIARGNHPPYSVPSAVVLHDERAAFEAWMRGCEGYPYAGQYANLMWKAWQARAASPQATATQPVQTERALTGIDQIAAVLASEIECGIFERHVVPALDAARKVLASGDKA